MSERTSSVTKTLPRIACVQQPQSGNGIKKQESKAAGKDWSGTVSFFLSHECLKMDVQSALMPDLTQIAFLNRWPWTSQLSDFVSGERRIISPREERVWPQCVTHH